jgi:hypothetical protein
MHGLQEFIPMCRRLRKPWTSAAKHIIRQINLLDDRPVVFLLFYHDLALILNSCGLAQ